MGMLSVVQENKSPTIAPELEEWIRCILYLMITEQLSLKSVH